MSDLKHIIIGLGGTGGNVIKNFRQQIVEKYGDIQVDVLNDIEFLYVDSKQSEFDDDKWEYQGTDIKLFGESNLVIKAGVLKDKLNNYSNRPEFLGNDSDWGDILLDKELAKKAGNQMRRLGRVNLIDNIDKIIAIIWTKYDQLTNRTNSKLQIHIIAGLAGGTGSGSIIDVTANLLKKFEDLSSKVSINLYLKIPELQVPEGWGGQFTGTNKNISFYQINGYAALKEINGLATGTFNPRDITKKRDKIQTNNLIQSIYLFAGSNSKEIRFSDIFTPIASILYLKTVTITATTTTGTPQTFYQILEAIDAGENITDIPANYWGLTCKYRIPGIFKICVPKMQIRESFAYLLVLNAFNKLLYKNFDKIAGKGYLGSSPQTKDVQNEKNNITLTLNTALLQDWYLTYKYLILDEPMIDKNNKLLTEGRDDYSFSSSFNKAYKKHITLLSTTKQYNGSFIKDNELLKFLQLTINDYFNKEYKGFGYEGYYSNMLNNIPQVADFLANRIKDKIFSNAVNLKYPLESYSDILLYIAQDYIAKFEKDLLNKQQILTKQVQQRQIELKNINKEYIDSFGLIFNNAKKREKSIENYQEALRVFWQSTIELKGISFAIQLINSQLKKKLLEIEKEVENKIKKIIDRRNKLNQEYEEEKRKLTGNQEIQGFNVVSNDEGIEQFQTELMKNEKLFDSVIDGLANLIYEHKDKVFQDVDALRNKDLPIMKDAYKKIDELLSDRNFSDMNLEDNFYNAHIIEVLYNKFNKDANNAKLKKMFDDMNNFSSPLSTVNSMDKGIKTTHRRIVILPKLQGLNQNNNGILQFYSNLQNTIKTTLGFGGNDDIIEINDGRFKNEISIAQFFEPIKPDQIENIIKLKEKYDELKNDHQVHFLMHTEDIQCLVDLVPPHTPDEMKNLLLPYLLILNSVDDGFEDYGEEKYWKITEVIVDSGIVHNTKVVTVYLESKSIDGFLSCDFKTLDRKNSNAEIDGFINASVYNVIRTKAMKLIDNTDASEKISKSLISFLDSYLVKVKNDTTNINYLRYRDAYVLAEKLINNK